jgi:ADP-ribosyl-[dinitrogen reductase] hydrolase
MRDRFRGAMLGLALGDAVGKRTDGLSPEEAAVAAGDDSSTAFRLRAGQFTAVTQAAVALALGLVEQRGYHRGVAAARYLLWFRSGDLRGVDSCTLAALSAIESGTDPARAGARGPEARSLVPLCRAVPIGLAFEGEEAEVAAAVDCKVTHREAVTVDACSKSARLLSRVARGEAGVDELNALRGPDGFAPLSDALAHVVAADADPAKALAACAAVGGEARARTALAAAFCGALRGEGALDARLLAELESREDLASLAENLLALAAPDEL